MVLPRSETSCSTSPTRFAPVVGIRSRSHRREYPNGGLLLRIAAKEIAFWKSFVTNHFLGQMPRLQNMRQKCSQVGHRTTQAPSQGLNINRSASLASLKVAHAFDSRLDDYAIVIHGIAQRMPWPCLRLHVCSEFSVETCSTYSCTSIQA